jgi:hypothetical protein
MVQHCFWTLAILGRASLLACIFASEPALADIPLKTQSAFFNAQRISQIRSNLHALTNGASLKKQALDRADYWLKLSDDQVWELMFGPTIPRSWMVWSNGKCPACTNDVVMYEWQIEARKRPWKTQCPDCGEAFPKNDFGAFYRSGLDARGVFDLKLADRKLLFNQEHPDQNDPLRTFGVDDGTGFVQGDNRWRFISAYLVYGQFKQLVRDGIQALAEAWVLTGDPACARKAGILLDRVADLYPEMDYASQGFVYEKPGHNGYVSVWHDACEETREMVLAYDQVFEGIRADSQLVSFLSAQAAKYGLENKKGSFADIQRNIEERLLRDALKSTHKMHSNFPRRETAYTTIQAVLGWPGNRAEVETYMAGFIKQATAVDGVTGEKGLSGYTAFTINGLALLLAEFSRAEPGFLASMIEKVPTLRQTWRFHIDTLCLDKFYPNSGDCGIFGQAAPNHVGAPFAKLSSPSLAPSMFTFFWQLYEATGDAAYVQALYKENGDSIEGLPHDLCAINPNAIREGARALIAEKGSRPVIGSVHESGWHIGILRSGEGANARAAWLDYDAGGAHGHLDGMNIGLFAAGADLLPDFGYPPVQHGGWTTPQVAWYLSPAAHNTVTVDGQSQRAGTGQCTLWADGEMAHIMRASAPGLIDIQQFERTLLLVDVSPLSFYLVDLFRVRSGANHTKFLHGQKAQMSTTGLELGPATAYGRGAMMRNFQSDSEPAAGWHADWAIPAFLTGGTAVTMRYTDWTEGATALTAEANVMPYKYDPPQGFWIPSLLIQRTGTAPLASCFVSTIEVFGRAPVINKAARVAVLHGGMQCTNNCVALSFSLEEQSADLLVAAGELHRGLPIQIGGRGDVTAFNGDTCLFRTKSGRPSRLVLCRASQFHATGVSVECDEDAEILEIVLNERSHQLVRGDVAALKELRLK